MFTAAYDALMNRPGWRRLSFHHFGDAQQERSVYNQVRSGGMDTLGLGCGGGGQLVNLSYMNAMDVQQYVDAWSDGCRPPAMAFEQPQRVTELGGVYRLTESDGIERAQLNELLPNASPTIDRLIALGLLHECNGRLELTRDGCFWGYNVTTLLTEAIADELACGVTPAQPTGHPPHIVTHPQGVRPCSSSSTA
jgi:coproporphyrinogen III oxidase-like Fe-S oxidoreductase